MRPCGDLRHRRTRGCKTATHPLPAGRQSGAVGPGKVSPAGGVRRLPTPLSGKCRRDSNNGHLWDCRSGHFASAKRVSSALRIEVAGRPGRGGEVPGDGVGPGVGRCSLHGEEAVYEEAIRGVFRHLVQAGVSTAAICRELGISRQTAYNWKASGGEGSASGQESGTYGPRSRSGSLLDPYRDLIEYRLREFPSLSAVRLFAEIRVLAGFEKVPLLGGQNVPLGFGRTGSAELVQGCALD